MRFVQVQIVDLLLSTFYCNSTHKTTHSDQLNQSHFNFDISY